MKTSWYAAVAVLVTLCSLVTPSAAQEEGGLALVSDLPSGQPVGTTVTWTVTGGGPTLDYRLLIARPGGPLRLRQDYTVKNAFEWTPLQEGRYRIVAVARNPANGQRERLRANFVVSPATMGTPQVSSTRNPLVALYSAPPCALGLAMFVSFAEAGGEPQNTATKPCSSTRTMNFLIAGMLAETRYFLRHTIVTAEGVPVEFGPPQSFTTGTPTVQLLNVSVVVPPTPDASTDEPLFLWGPTSGNGVPFATDSEGRVTWYYENPNEGEDRITLTRLTPGGNLLILVTPQVVHAPDRLLLREIDLAGNTVRETNARRLAEQFAQNGGQVFFTTLHHEARRLPNGHTVLLAHSEKFVIDQQGPGPVDVLSDIVLALDENWQVVWQWDGFDHMDIEREALLGEVCVSDEPGCPILFLADEANDWLHSNALGYSPADGNLILSVRHQDWVVKLDYQNGAGSGDVVWRLGNEGDFGLIQEGVLGPWFSHQHDNNYLGVDRVLLYDNGNGNEACLADPADCLSRVQVYRLDELNMTAELEHNLSLQKYAFAVGATQRLANGNFYANSGFTDGQFVATGDEITPEGEIVHALQVDASVYRSFRLRDLYTPPDAN